jgi:LysR family hydrogen peroxide-inducible transcriptional activator
MEFRQLLYVVQIATEKSFSRAADKLHIAQPSLSQQIAKLEKEIGVVLFHRNSSSVELTQAGTLFVERSQFIIDHMEQLKTRNSRFDSIEKRKVNYRKHADDRRYDFTESASCVPSSIP